MKLGKTGNGDIDDFSHQVKPHAVPGPEADVADIIRILAPGTVLKRMGNLHRLSPEAREDIRRVAEGLRKQVPEQSLALKKRTNQLRR